MKLLLSILQEKVLTFVTARHQRAREATFGSSYAHTIRDNAVSGGIAEDVVFPHRILLYMRLETTGQMINSPAPLRRLIAILTAGVVDTKKNNGAEVATVSLDAHHVAIENTAKIVYWDPVR